MESKTCQKRFIVSSINSDLSVKNGSSSWGSKHSEPTETKKKRILPRVPAKTGETSQRSVDDALPGLPTELTFLFDLWETRELAKTVQLAQ